MKCVGGFAFAFIMEKELHSSLGPVLANYCTFQYKNHLYMDGCSKGQEHITPSQSVFLNCRWDG